MSSPFTLAVCAEMVFTELPFEERVRRLDALGFEVEIWGWRAKDISTLAATEASFSSMTGYISGDLVDPGRADELLRTAELSIPNARRLGIPRLNLRTDRCVPDLGEPVPHRDGGCGRRCCGGFLDDHVVVSEVLLWPHLVVRASTGRRVRSTRR